MVTIKNVKKLVVLGAAALSLYLAAAGGLYEELGADVAERVREGRMKNVTVIENTPEASPTGTIPVAAVQPPTPIPTPEATAASAATPQPESVPESEDDTLPAVLIRDGNEIRSTTITGGLAIRNSTSYVVDVSALVAAGTDITLPVDDAQILIIHTHSSEAYSPAGLDRYQASDSARTEDTNFNIIRIGDELTDIYTKAGLNVIHDRGIYDYPSYTGSYGRSGDAISQYLQLHPGIKIVIDMHRDALGENGVIYKTVAEESGVCASQVMMLVGSDESGLEHPNWRSNLALAMYLQNAVDTAHPSLMRPISLVAQRYNQHLSPGSFILEVGCSGNTLQEALAAIRLYGEATTAALLALVQ